MFLSLALLCLHQAVHMSVCLPLCLSDSPSASLCVGRAGTLSPCNLLAPSRGRRAGQAFYHLAAHHPGHMSSSRSCMSLGARVGLPGDAPAFSLSLQQTFPLSYRSCLALFAALVCLSLALPLAEFGDTTNSIWKHAPPPDDLVSACTWRVLRSSR